MGNKYVCIHGHFYQPPRENPWLNQVEIQDSAYPYHDWNERINAECYARNSASRILDTDSRIVDIVNNYSKISFNFGPTLLSWMEEKAPDIYQKILEADRISRENFSGHGSSLAQAFNHTIMPLTNIRDRITQVKWGIANFETRFGRMPEGMWCGETAMDNDTLEILADHGIKFTILSPYQAKRVRPADEEEWTDVVGGKIDPRRGYSCKLSSGKDIAIFFYDGPVSQGIAFEGLLNSGEEFAGRLMQGFLDEDRPQLMNIATDGETYGHHHQYGEMALSYCLHHIAAEDLAQITIYGEFLEKYPPEYEVEIIENTSWSCYHGVERWRSNCGCSSGMNGRWNQEWRGPLRVALDWLRDELVQPYENAMKKYHDHPWQLRNEYVELIINRARENVELFFVEKFSKELKDVEKVEVLKLLEMQYHTMLMYTSCGWFFDEVTGIETMQDIAYAGRAIQLAEEVLNARLEEEFIRLLENAKSNIPKYQNAGWAYKHFIQPSKININRVGAHYAISSLFSAYPEELKIYSFYAHSVKYLTYKSGRYRLAVGRTEITSEITWEKEEITFAILHLGENNLFGGVKVISNGRSFETVHNEIKEVFCNHNIHEVIVLMDKYFGSHNYSFWHLFKEDQQRIMENIMTNSLKNIESTFLQVYDINYPLLNALHNLDLPVPTPLKISADYVVNSKLKREIKKNELDLKVFRELIDEINRLSVELDFVTLNFIATKKINRLIDRLYEQYDDTVLMLHIIDFIGILGKIDIRADYWKAQNKAFILRKKYYDNIKNKADDGDPEAQAWRRLFDKLYSRLNLKV